MADGRTIASALDEPDTSLLIKRVLQACLPSRNGTVDVGSFLRAVDLVGAGELQANSAAAWHAVVAGGSRARVAPLASPTEKTAPGAALSPGLVEAFDDARALRRHIGGRDRYIGLRHILSAICVPREGSTLASEFAAYCADVRRPASAFRQAMLREVLSAPEVQERLELWESHFHGGVAREGIPSSRVLTTAGTAPWTLEGLGATANELRAEAEREPVSVEAEVAPVELTGEDLQALGAPPPPSAAQIMDPGGYSVFPVATADDPFAAGVVDRFDASREAEAFAMLATARAITPPLAIGVFGRWGSGKSFFLRLIREHIANLKDQETETPFHTEVVPVLFNAWHYADTNLWASLVHHIFTELDQWSRPTATTPSLLDTLDSSRTFTLESAATLVESRRLQREAAQRYERARQETLTAQSTLRAKLTNLAEVTLASLSTDTEKQKRVKAAAATLGLSDTLETAEDLKDALGELDAELINSGFVRGAVMRVATSAAALGVTAAGVVVGPIVSALVAHYLLKLPDVSGFALSGAVAPLVTGGAFAATKARDAVRELRKARPWIDAAKAKTAEKLATGLVEESNDLAGKTAAEATAKAAFDAANERASLAADDYHSGTGRARLLSFVRQRVEDGDYSRQLSFIATVRRDFESLSKLMADAGDTATENEVEARAKDHAQRIDAIVASAGDLLTDGEVAQLEASVAAKGGEGRPFHRIVLYIDDLDRCPPAKVVEVLQAIHLLLAFPLFVVFVAVDVRWLVNSLKAGYPELIDLSNASGRASPSDYLEKIFQIPYWVRPVTDGGVANLLADRLQAFLPLHPPSSAASNAAPPKAVEPIPLPAPTEDHGAAAELAEVLGDHLSTSSQVMPTAEPLRITPAEASYLARLAPALATSPRRVLRFVNSYSLIKASLDPAARSQIEEGDFRALLTLLAIAVGSEDKSRKVFDRVRASASIEMVLEDDFPQSSTCQAAITCCKDAGASVEDLRRYIPLVDRFTFLGPEQ